MVNISKIKIDLLFIWNSYIHSHQIRMKNILLILLGCNVYSIMFNRLETSFNFINKNITNKKNFDRTIEITWFLSGGIKNKNEGHKSEASIMKSRIDDVINTKYKNTSIINNYNQEIKYNNEIIWKFILDTKSTNTAENIINASKFLNNTNKKYNEIYIITSEFHYNRANQMLKLIDPKNIYKWILGNVEEKDSRYWEKIHIRNIHGDVHKAKNNI